jgi:ankyrin repeat protein
MSDVTELHDAVRRGDIAVMKELLVANRTLANSRSETDQRGTYPLHLAAEFDQPSAARLLLDYGADVSLLDLENNAIPLWLGGILRSPRSRSASACGGFGT